jgi:protein-L-isoaspartate(D-aspartate) O-methyltransferase
MNDKGVVVGIEHISQLYQKGYNNVCKSHEKLIKDKKIILLENDGRLGVTEYAPYDCIHVGAGIIILIFKLLRKFLTS